MRTTVPHIQRRICFLCAATAIVLVALLILACVMKADVESIRQENTISVPSERVDSRTERALESMARAFHGWAR